MTPGQRLVRCRPDEADRRCSTPDSTTDGQAFVLERGGLLIVTCDALAGNVGDAHRRVHGARAPATPRRCRSGVGGRVSHTGVIEGLRSEKTPLLRKGFNDRVDSCQDSVVAMGVIDMQYPPLAINRAGGAARRHPADDATFLTARSRPTSRRSRSTRRDRGCAAAKRGIACGCECRVGVQVAGVNSAVNGAIADVCKVTLEHPWGG